MNGPEKRKQYIYIFFFLPFWKHHMADINDIYNKRETTKDCIRI